jgi:hypothetical protein
MARLITHKGPLIVVSQSDLEALLDHGGIQGLADDDHTQYILHSLADAANDFLVASGANTYIKKTLAETGAILEADLNHDNLQGIVAGEHYLALDEDNMVSDSAVNTATQQSIKKYVDDNAGGAIDISGTPVTNDIARWTDGDTLEGRSYAEFKADLDLEIGTDILAEQTIGIADNNLVEIDHAAVADNDFAKFTANGLEGRSYAETLSDILAMGLAGGTFTGAVEPADHGTATNPEIVAVVYGTGTPPTANTTPIGTLWVKYTA